MSNAVAVAVAAMVALIIALDVLFLRDLFWVRLGVNVAIVLAFAVVYAVWLR